MKKILIAILWIMGAVNISFAQDVTISTVSSTITLQNGSPATGTGLLGVFIDLDNTTPTSVSAIQANYANLSWMAARFRPFGDGTPITGETFSFAGGLISPTPLIDDNFNSVTGATSPSPGSASSINYNGLTPYVWLFSGPVPTTQAAYDLLETGVFSTAAGGLEFLPTPFSPSQSFTFTDPSLFNNISEIVSSGAPGDANFGLVAVPEPSTVALALLGAAGVMIARRRRKQSGRHNI